MIPVTQHFLVLSSSATCIIRAAIGSLSMSINDTFSQYFTAHISAYILLGYVPLSSMTAAFGVLFSGSPIDIFKDLNMSHFNTSVHIKFTVLRSK